ncbi:MAG: hypothetical protein U1F83_05080, partial [Verrucomicrobiota bacterium]
GINTPTISLSSNGVLFFGQNASTSWINTGLPANISNDAMLFFFWDDLQDFGTGEYLEYATFGTAPGRVFNLYFRSRLHDTAVCGSNAVNLMISIHESSGLMKVTYSGFSGCANIRGSGATFGFQTPGGANAAAFMVGYNAPVLDDNATNQNMCFHPPN